MFKELLESVGFDVHTQKEIFYIDKKLKYTHNILYVMVDELLDNGNAISFVKNYGESIKEDEAIEQACMQYCIENDIKKSWLDKIGMKLFTVSKGNYCIEIHKNTKLNLRLWNLIMGYEIKII